MALKITQTIETVEREYKGVKLIIGRSNSFEFRSKLQLETKRRSRGGDFSKLSTSDQDEAMASASVGTVLCGWSNFKVNGVEIPFTPENAKDLLLSDPDAKEFILAVGSELAEFEDAAKEELQKKS